MHQYYHKQTPNAEVCKKMIDQEACHFIITLLKYCIRHVGPNELNNVKCGAPLDRCSRKWLAKHMLIRIKVIGNDLTCKRVSMDWKTNQPCYNLLAKKHIAMASDQSIHGLIEVIS